MKKTIVILASLALFMGLISCGEAGNQEATEAGFSKIEKEIKSEFGEDAHFTKLSVMYNKSIGNMIVAMVTDDPESLKMGEWTQSQGSWKQTSEITLEVSEGTKAADYMFQLKDQINLGKLGELIEQSKKQLEEEKSLENTQLSIASIYFPNNGDISKATYNIDLKPENGGTTFSFIYKLDGELIKMDY